MPQRLHMFSPLPPARNGVADYAALLRPALAAHYEVICEPGETSLGPLPEGARVLHQLGNSPGHAVTLRALRRHPGLAVLHDLTLAVPLREAETEEALRTALRALSPGLGGTLGEAWLAEGRLPGAAAAAFPLLGQALANARAAIVHSQHARRRLATLWPPIAARIAVIPHLAPLAAPDRAAARTALGLPQDRFLLLTAGFAAWAKRLDWVAEAVTEARRRGARLLWIHAGEGEAAAIAPALAAAGAFRATGYLPEPLLATHLAACDALANLRAPSVGESSGTLARALGAGRCAFVSDVAGYAELPRDAVLHLPPLAPQRALAEALLALEGDRGLADAVGRRAADHARAVLAPERVALAYRQAIEEFRNAPPPVPAPAVGRGRTPRLLLVSPVPPWPVRAGNAARLLALGGALSCRGLPAELACPLPRLSAEDERRRRRDWAALHPLPWRPRHAPTHPDRWALDDWCPVETVEAVAALHRARRYDAVIASYTWLSAVLDAVPGALRVLDTHDLLGGRREAALAAGLAPSWFWTGEAEEARGLDRADLVLGIQPEEGALLRRRTRRPVLVVGHAPRPRARPPGAAPFPFGLLASGNVWNRHAVAALDRALAAHPRGRGLPWLLGGAIRPEGRLRSGVVATGPVAEAAEFHRLIGCAVNPMEGGTGLKIKTVEALCDGLPVIGTRHAFAGLSPDHPAQQAADAAEVADWMAEHESSAPLRAALEEASRTLARRWHAAVEAGLDALAAVLRSGRVPEAAAGDRGLSPAG
ncbi:glycosyltransferase [Roseomonas cutis]|uniref:glycosyltransferase n=1 Tax=Roseomonas cutis TaxID=2897332 RepID=UPI00272B5545|nr:glycosyltransferase [Roseomonas sp. OT10]